MRSKPQIQTTNQVNETPRPRSATRHFRSWWYRDMARSGLPLIGITCLIVAANALVWTAARLTLPQLHDLLVTQTLSGALKAGIGLLGQPLGLILFGMVLLVANLMLIEWAALILAKRTFGADRLSNRSVGFSRFAGLILTTIIALLILLGILLIGAGLAYGASRWYFGVVFPIILITLLVLSLFLSWFIFLPFVMLKNGISGPRALSECRVRARQVRGRLLILIILIGAILLALLFEFNGLTRFARFSLGLLMIPVGLSLLATLYAESESLGPEK